MSDARSQGPSLLKRRQRTSWDYIKRFCPQYVSKSKRFSALVAGHLGPEIEMVDLGCGRGSETPIVYKDHTRHSFGVDISEAVFQNQTIHEPLLGSAYDIPLQDASVDLVVSQELLEHLEAPQKAFDEIARILRPGGVFAAMTPHFWYPSMILSYLTPYSFHKLANKLLHDIDPADVFPTRYRANTLRRLTQLGRRAGLRVTYHEYFQSNPGELSFSPLLTRAEVAYFRLVSRFDTLSALRDIIIVFFRKPR